MTETERFETWAILELMGHRRLAGKVSEQTIAGAAFLRIDLPAVGTTPAATQWYSAAAVYAITPTTEDTARRAAAANSVAPVSQWELPRLSTGIADTPIDDLDYDRRDEEAI